MENQVDDQASSGDAESGKDVNSNYVEGMVPKSNFDKVMKQRISFRDENEQLKSRLQSFEQAEMERTGKHEDLIKSLRDQLTEREALLKDKDAKYFGSQFKNSFANAAKEKGCVDPDGLMKMLGKEAFKAVEIDDNFNVNSGDLNNLLDKAKQEKGYMFKESKGFVDAIPGKVAMNDFDPVKKDLNEMSGSERRQEIDRLLNETIKNLN